LRGNVYLKIFEFGPVATLALGLLGLKFASYNASYLFCIFAPPPTPLIKVVHSGSVHCALSLFICLRTVSGLSRPCWRWSESKSIVRS